jgi:hypothetical protein
VLAVAFLVGSLTYSGILYRHIALDSGLVVDASDTVLQDPAVQHRVAGWVSTAVYDQFLMRDPQAKQVVLALQSFNIDVKADSRVIADRLVASPTFRTVFSSSIGAMHHYVLVDRSGPPPTIDLSPIVPTVREIAISVRANYAALPDVPMDIRVAVPRSALPDGTWTSRTITADRLRTAATLVILAMLAAIVVHPNRPKALRRVGRFFVGLGLGQVLVVLALPLAIGRLPDDAAPIASALLGVLRPRLLAPAGLVVAIGVGLWVAGRQWRRAEGHRRADEGRRAFTDGPGRFGTSQYGGRAQPGPSGRGPAPVVVAPLSAYERGALRPNPAPVAPSRPATAATAVSMTAPLVPPRAGPGPAATSVLPVLPGPTPVTGVHRPPAGASGATAAGPIAPTSAHSSASVFADLGDAHDEAPDTVEDLPHGSDPFAWLSTLAGLEAQPGAQTPGVSPHGTPPHGTRPHGTPTRGADG